MILLRTTLLAATLCAVALLGAQTTFPYGIHLAPFPIEGLDGIHSFAHAQHEGRWLLIGGRLDGIHARQPFNAFPAAQNNTAIQVVDPQTNTVWTADLTALAVGLQEQLQATNMQFYQEGDQLLLVGGYAYSSSAGDHLTFPYLTVVDVPGLIADIINSEPIAGNFQQLTDDKFAVTGGYLGKIGDEFYLVGGHRFDGRYNPMNHPTFTQTYTDAIRKFTLTATNGNLGFTNYTVISDPAHLHRRDYNLLPQIYPDGNLGYTIFSGVFQINQDLPFLYPVDITAAGHQPVSSFNQYLCNYHAAHLPLYDEAANSMHNLFFGGISQYYYQAGNLVQDDNVPFVKTISRVSRSSDGTLEEVPFSLEMPGYLGAGAELMINEDLPQSAPGIIDLAAVEADSFLVGYIVGGISTPTANPFSVNNTGITSAATTVFKVYLVKNSTTGTHTSVPGGYHNFAFTVVPNPGRGKTLTATAFLPEPGDLDIYLIDTSGRLILQETRKNLPAGDQQLNLPLPTHLPGLGVLTLVLNGKYTASEKLILD
ncbi:MAG: hypothetical protein DA408_15585 [Bacteroidetes bacterium]|nr:MAG: hypothetical protein C7N36_14120 [Bacteroidota bacterium]PTM10588.1 MAG: hypothetical protein DA408_15585 [Bacteroidota bacterium]